MIFNKILDRHVSTYDINLLGIRALEQKNNEHVTYFFESKDNTLVVAVIVSDTNTIPRNKINKLYCFNNCVGQKVSKHPIPVFKVIGNIECVGDVKLYSDDEGYLHNVNGPAIESTTAKSYYIHGTCVDIETFWNYIKKTEYSSQFFVKYMKSNLINE